MKKLLATAACALILSACANSGDKAPQPEQQAAQRIIYAVQTGLELSGDGRDPDSGEYDKGQGTT